MDILRDGSWYLVVVLICISLVISGAEHLLMCLTAFLCLLWSSVYLDIWPIFCRVVWCFDIELPEQFACFGDEVPVGLSLLTFFSILRVDFSFTLGFPLLCRCFYGPWGSCYWLLFYFSLSGGSKKNLLWFISKRVLCIFSLKRFTVIIPPFRFLIDFEFDFLYGVRELSWFHSLFPGLRSFRLILHGGCPHFTLLPSVYEGSLFSTASPGLTAPRLLKKGQSGRWEAIPHYNLDLHFSKMSGGETFPLIF